MLQGFVEFLGRRHRFIRTTAGVTKGRDVRRQDRRRLRKLLEIAMQLRRLSDQIFDVVRLGKGIVLRAASSIQFATLGEHLVKQGSPQVFVAVNLSARGNEHVLEKTQTT